MAERDGSPVNIDFRLVKAEIAQDRKTLRSKRLIHLGDIDIGDRKTGPVNAFREADTGPIPMISGAQPETAMLRMRASGFNPWRFA